MATKSDVRTVRLTAAQIEALRALAAKDDTAKAVVAKLDNPTLRAPGSFEKVVRMVAKDPNVKLEEVVKAHPDLKGAKFDYNRALKVVKIMKEVGRWRDVPEWPESGKTAVELKGATKLPTQGKKAA